MGTGTRRMAAMATRTTHTRINLLIHFRSFWNSFWKTHYLLKAHLGTEENTVACLQGSTSYCALLVYAARSLYFFIAGSESMGRFGEWEDGMERDRTHCLEHKRRFWEDD